MHWLRRALLSETNPFTTQSVKPLFPALWEKNGGIGGIYYGMVRFLYMPIPSWEIDKALSREDAGALVERPADWLIG